MFRILLAIFLLSIFSLTVDAQTVILDFETTETSTTFQSFGNSQEGVISEPVTNPNPSGDNTSATVLAYTKAGDAPGWGGAFSNPDPARAISLTSTHFCVKAHMDHIGNIAMKFEGGQAGAPDWIQKMNTTKVNNWGEICFDVSLPSLEAPEAPAAGNTYTRIVFFVDFDIEGTGDGVTTYLDDFVVKDHEIVIEPPTGDMTTILDFETNETSTDFQSFGGTESEVVKSPIANPNPSGINTSAMVMPHVKAGDAPIWGGAFSNPNPTRKIDLTTANQICVKTHKDHTGNFTLKLEEGEGAADWIYSMPTTKVGEWEEICFDVNLPSIEDPTSIAKGNVYNKIVFFMDFDIEGTGEDVTSYLDDFIVKSASTGGEPVDVTFTLNTGNLADVTSVHVNGSFNDWCGDCNEMTDDNADGIYTITISIESGAHEYKFTVNGSEETLTHTMECIKVTDEFINRFGIFTESTELAPVAFGSCYNAGDGVNMTFRLGFPDGVTPADSIYLAGGDNFDSPGGRFRLLDNNNDGIYEITVERLKGFSSYYTFANGNCPGWDCKEDIGGQDCAQPDNFNDRWLPAVEEDVIISTCYGLCSTTANCSADRVDVGFAIDMKEYEGNFSDLHVSGSFNDYCGDCDVLSDDDNDGVYTATVSVPTGNLEYYYIVDGVAESFPRGSECGVSGNDSRNDFVVEDKQMDATCFNSCYACGQAVSLIFRLGFPDGVEPADEVYLAGGINFEEPGGRFQLLDDDDDGIYEMVLERGLGFSSYYTFTNGNCPGDWGCKELIEGQDCAQPDNFNDRWLPELTGDTVIETCFGMCTTDTEACQGLFINRFDVDNNMFQLVPNFTQDLAKVSFNSVTTDSKLIKVFDNVGRLIFATKLNGNELEYALSTYVWNNGMYFVQVQVGNTLGSQKLMKY